MAAFNFSRLRLSGTLWLLLVVGLLFPDNVCGQQVSSGEVSATWELKDEIVVITYELLDVPLDRTYNVGVVLTRESDPNFRIVPKTVEGAVGHIEYTGGKREIRWDYREDIPGGLVGEDYRFEFTVTEVVEEDRIDWRLVVAGGAAVLGIWLIQSELSHPVNFLPDPPLERPSK